MTTWAPELSLRLEARIAAVLCLVIIAGAVLVPFSVAPTGMMRGEAALPTIAGILADKPLYVVSGIVQLVLGACGVAVALIFYELLKPVSRELALLAAYFRIAFVAIASANVVNHFAPLLLLSGGHSLGYTQGQLQALALMFIRLRTTGFDIALIFFGIHWLIAGYLFYRSSFCPRILGVLLMVGGVGYMANIFADIIPPAIASHLFPYVMMPAGFAEISLPVWLAFAGLNDRRWNEQAGLAAAT